MASSHPAARLAVQTLIPGDNTDKDKTASLTPPETPVKDSRDAAEYALQKPIEFLYDLEIERARDDASRFVEFGRGVWSAVYKATTTWMPSSSSNNTTLTPPPSPTPSPASTAGSSSRSRILAVKTPLRRDAHPVLKAEAWILTLTSRKSTPSTQHTVPFYGYIPSSNSLVLQAIPLSLSAHIETCADHACRNFSTRTMFEPVLSSAHWRALSAQLIRGLDWLHNEVGVVHGDIKPHNILLRERQSLAADEFPYEALYADFSSAHHMSADKSSLETGTTGSALSALTPPFAAPELMTLAALKSTSPSSLSTPASDVFALALTLLAAATGDALVYSLASSATSDMQRLAMSREGHRAIEYVRSGPQASRVVRGGVVERTVAPAIRKGPDERVVAGEWRVAE